MYHTVCARVSYQDCSIALRLLDQVFAAVNLAYVAFRLSGYTAAAFHSKAKDRDAMLTEWLQNRSLFIIVFACVDNASTIARACGMRSHCGKHDNKNRHDHR